MDKEKIDSLISDLQSKEVTLVAVSKTKPISAIQTIYNLGVREFGENRVQELSDKYTELPKDINWHMIGSLQRNKVKYIAPFVHLIHSVTSESLLETIEKEAAKNNRRIDVLLQIRIATEETKQGLNKHEISELLQSINEGHYAHIRCKGFMGMASFTDDKKQVTHEFESLQHIASQAAEDFPKLDLSTRSFGMSGDYDLAIEAGANMVRIGSLIFGSRNYN